MLSDALFDTSISLNEIKRNENLISWPIYSLNATQPKNLVKGPWTWDSRPRLLQHKFSKKQYGLFEHLRIHTNLSDEIFSGSLDFWLIIFISDFDVGKLAKSI